MEIELRNSGGAHLGPFWRGGVGGGEGEGLRAPGLRIGPTESAYIRTVARKHLSNDTALQSLLTPAPSLLIVAINGARLINCATGP